MKGKQLFVVDGGVLLNMVERRKDGGELLKVLTKLKKDGASEFSGYTTVECLLYAIWKADSNIKIGRIQEVIEILGVVGAIDYKNDEVRRQQLMEMANSLSGGL